MLTLNKKRKIDNILKNKRIAEKFLNHVLSLKKLQINKSVKSLN